MKKLIVFCFWMLGVLAGVLAQNGNPYWREVNRPDGGGNTEIFVTNDSVCYNYSNQGGPVYRSTDMGLHWNKLNIPTWGTDSTFIVGTTGNLYMTRRTSSGLFALERSQDLGNTWTLVNANIPSRNLIETRAGSLIAYTATKTHRSTNGGLNWNLVGNLNIGNIKEWQPGLLTETLSGSFEISADDGVTWTVSNSNQFKRGFGGIAVISKDTFVAYRGDFIYRSFNQGIKWDSTSLNLPLNAQTTSILALPSGRILLYSDQKILFSDDFGVTWTLIPPSPGGRQPSYFAVVLPNGDILGKDGKYDNTTIWRSSDGGWHWAFSSRGIHLAKILELKFFSDSSLLAITTDGISKTEDQGSHWVLLLTDSTITTDLGLYTKASVVNADTFVVVANSTLYLTLNSGTAFSGINPIMGARTVDCFIDPQSKRIICSVISPDFVPEFQGFYGICISDDLGVTWTKKPALGTYHSGAINKAVRHPSGKIFAWSQGKLIRSDDNGDTWHKVTLPTSFFPLEEYKIKINAQGNIYIEGRMASTSVLAISPDEGNSWSVQQVSGNMDFGHGIDVNDLGHIYLTLDDMAPQDKLAGSINHGESWFNLPLPVGYQSFGTSQPLIAVSPGGYLYTISATSVLDLLR